MVLDVVFLVRAQIFGGHATLSINLLRHIGPWHGNTWRRYLDWIYLVVRVMDASISPM